MLTVVYDSLNVEKLIAGLFTFTEQTNLTLTRLMEKDMRRSTLEDTDNTRQNLEVNDNARQNLSTCTHAHQILVPSMSCRPFIDGHECPCLAAHILANIEGTVSRILLQTKQSLSYLSALVSHF